MSFFLLVGMQPITYPSILILGYTELKRPIHIVASYNENDDYAYLITVYHPDSELWINYIERRK